MRDSPVHCKMLNSTPDLHPLHANNKSPPFPVPSCDNQECLQTLPSGFFGKNYPWLGTMVYSVKKWY